MKYSIVFLLLIMISISTLAQVDLGIIGGVNLANIKQENIGIIETKGRTLLGIGAVIDIHLLDNLSIQTEPMYIEKGSKLTPEEVGLSNYTSTFSYLEIPVMLKYFIGNTFKPYLVAGGAASFRLSTKVQMDIGNSAFTGSVDNVTKAIEYSLTFGGGIEYDLYPITIFIEGRYSFSLGNQVKPGDFTINSGQFSLPGNIAEGDIYKNKGIQIFAGVTIPLSIL